MLSERPMCVCEINDVLHIALSTISAHLKTLKYAGIICDSKDGRWIEYRIVPDEYILELIHNIKKELKDSDIIKHDLEKIRKIDKFSCTNI